MGSSSSATRYRLSVSRSRRPSLVTPKVMSRRRYSGWRRPPTYLTDAGLLGLTLHDVVVGGSQWLAVQTPPIDKRALASGVPGHGMRGSPGRHHQTGHVTVQPACKIHRCNSGFHGYLRSSRGTFGMCFRGAPRARIVAVEGNGGGQGRDLTADLPLFSKKVQSAKSVRAG
jgi:hypothetical protein